ncbi:carbohydrate kinase [Oscillospiraceae bacterium PP1C4]
MLDVTAIGELLIDFTPSGENAQGTALFARNPGGAPANVLAANSRLGGKTAFIGKVGKDGFGEFLKQTLMDNQIDSSGLIMTSEFPTTLAFVQLNEQGDRSFSFYRKPGADIMLTSQELKSDLLKNTSILHFGSVSLTDEPSRSATLEAVKIAKANGAIISYDPNYRPLLWEHADDAKTQMAVGLALADIVKVSEEEMVMLTGETDLMQGSLLLAKEGAALVLVSLGAKGAFYRRGDLYGRLPTYDVKTIDTNGAGDSFLGAVHYRLRGKQLSEIRAIPKEELEDILSFANAAGALTTTKSGAIPAMPCLDEIFTCLRTTPLLRAD